MPDESRSYPQARPAGNDGLRLDALDDDQLLASRCPGNEPDGAPPDAEFVGQEPDQCLVRGTADRGGRDMGAKDAVNSAIDEVRPSTWGQSDGESNVGVSQGSVPQGA